MYCRLAPFFQDTNMLHETRSNTRTNTCPGASPNTWCMHIAQRGFRVTMVWYIISKGLVLSFLQSPRQHRSFFLTWPPVTTCSVGLAQSHYLLVLSAHRKTSEHILRPAPPGCKLAIHCNSLLLILLACKCPFLYFIISGTERMVEFLPFAVRPWSISGYFPVDPLAIWELN